MRTVPAAAVSIALLATGLVTAQPPASAPNQPAAPAQPPVAPSQSPAALKAASEATITAAANLRARVEAVRTKRRVVPIVAIVSDAKSFVGAVSRWDVQSYFPVLIDDGTPQAREDIARFVRAFKPARVVRFDGAVGVFWPEKPEEQKGYLPHMIAKTLGFPDGVWMKKHAKDGTFKPNGIVLTTMTDPAWPAAVALCAGRGEMLAFATPNLAQGIDTATNVQWADKYNELAIDAAKDWGVSYAALGDTIDSVTLCMGSPNRIQIDKAGEAGGTAPFAAKPGEFLATTDFVGRLPETRARWAWAGQIFGTNASSTYRAMCSMFLQPDSAWIFDSYDAGEPWSLFSGRKAGEFFEKAGWRVWCNQPGKQGERDFRFAAGAFTAPDAEKHTDGSAGLDAGVILINSMGNADFFQLKPGNGLPGDVPLLNVPALVSMVHSWSAQSPGRPTTVGGRFLQHGAFAYVGSMHEPYLNAFVPTPQFAARMFVMPLGAAARHDVGIPAAPWRITVLGDPLYTFGPPAPRAEVPAEMTNTKPLEDELKAALAEKKFDVAINTLVLLGRDRDATRLGRALLEQELQDLTPAAALAATLPAYRCGEFELCAKLAMRAGKLVEDNLSVQDALWHAVDGQGRPPTRDQALALKLAVRPDSFARDAKTAADFLNAAAGPGTGRGLLRSLHSKATPEQRQQLEALMKSVP
ncbi:MAG: hypothetical protein ACREJO_12415 [Phycisphaerales bacterium]